MTGSAASVVKWGSHRIRLLPGWGARFSHGHFTTNDARSRPPGHGPHELETVRQPGGDRIPDVNRPGHTVQSSFQIHHEDISSAEEAADVVAAAMLATTFHEVIEWVTLDGERLADPHPSGEQQWEWVIARMLDTLDEYATLWPAPTLKENPDD